jgi:hypothetical protein
VFPSGEKTRPTWAFVCRITWVSAGLALLVPATLYKKMYCVELAGSTEPAALSSEFWPAQMIASVVPSGLSCDFRGSGAGRPTRVGQHRIRLPRTRTPLLFVFATFVLPSVPD